MSTRTDRAFRASRRILPIVVFVRQRDGRLDRQVVDTCVRVRTARRPRDGRAAVRLAQIAD